MNKAETAMSCQGDGDGEDRDQGWKLEQVWGKVVSVLKLKRATQRRVGLETKAAHANTSHTSTTTAPQLLYHHDNSVQHHSIHEYRRPTNYSADRIML